MVINSCRQLGFAGPQPIALIEIKAYFDIFGKVEDVEAFIEYVKYLDQVYIEIVSKNNGN